MDLHLKGPFPNIGGRTGPCTQGGCLICSKWKEGDTQGQDVFLHHTENAAGLEKWLAERRAAGQCAQSKVGDPQFLSLDPASPDFLKPAPGGPGAGVGAQIRSTEKPE